VVYSPPPINTALPATFNPSTSKVKKRSSDEFERESTGLLIKKHQRSPSGSILDNTKEERASARKHHSLGVGLPSRDKTRERRKDSISGSAARDRHSRRTSASSSSSSHGEQLHSRRVLTTDFSHLPPSPSTTSIQQFLRHTGSNGAISTSTPFGSQKDASNHYAPNVAHSLLRGTQEGWSDLDDQATAEALRKLDGLSGKSGTRVRSSVGSLRLVSTSRPGTPAKSAQQWEGVGSDSGKTSRRNSAHIRDSMALTKDKDQTPSASRQAAGLGDSVDNSEQFGSSDEAQLSSPAQEKPPVKKSSASIRLSYTTKRGSASSTTYASTPTTSSRDSGSMSTGTSLTSVSAQSGRHSTSKARRNSVGSDASQPGDVTALKDRAASLLTSSEQPEVGQDVPPVPPLPKDLSTYRSPPQSSTSASFPVEGANMEEATHSNDREPHQSAPTGGPAAIVTKPSSPPYTSHSDQGYASASAAPKTPSKKWSLLGMKLSGNPSANTAKDSSGGKASSKRQSPHSITFSRRSISKDPEPWSPVEHPDAMASAASLVSQSSLSSSHALSVSGAAVGTPDRHFSSRPGTASSSHKSSAPQQTPLSPSDSIRRGPSKRLTPSAIPFFRRSSSQSVQVGALRLSPPPASTGPSHLQSRDPVSPVDTSLSTPPSAHKKSSIISLGSLLKGSSSRRNLQAGKDDPRSDKESRRGRDTDGGKSDKEKAKKEKDRSESRISVLMGRKRGQVNPLQA
jgi:dual specificity tyrosine-phosphorylation-regulated kinase 2/3/4